MLKMTEVFKSFDQKRVLCGASIEADGKTVALMGGSGSGKTTVLRILSSLENADGGEVFADGKTAVVFAEPRLFDSVSVTENVAAVMDKSVPKAERARRAEEILSSLGLGDEIISKPSELSSGMAARVSLARAIAYDADNYLLDEPFKALDEETKKQVARYVFGTLKNKSVIMITHSEAEASLCDEIFILEDGKISKKTSAA